MQRRRAGFTVIELIIALLIGTILTSVAISTFQGVQAGFAVRNAKAMYATLHQRARAMSIEKGETVLFAVDAIGDSAFIWSISEGGITNVTNFRRELNVDLRAPTSYVLCMTPRGYADYNCGAFAGFFTATTNTTVRLEFWLNADSSSVLVLPMGQLVGL